MMEMWTKDLRAFPKLDAALLIAAREHSGQKDKQGRPYIYHVLHVGTQGATEAEVIVGLLHDYLEDCVAEKDWPGEIEDLRALFGDEITDGIVAMSQYGAEGYDVYIRRLAQNTIARRVKLYDLRHNMDRLVGLPVEGQERLRQKYAWAWEYLMEGAI